MITSSLVVEVVVRAHRYGNSVLARSSVDAVLEACSILWKESGRS